MGVLYMNVSSNLSFSISSILIYVFFFSVSVLHLLHLAKWLALKLVRNTKGEIGINRQIPNSVGSLFSTEGQRTVFHFSYHFIRSVGFWFVFLLLELLHLNLVVNYGFQVFTNKFILFLASLI